MTDSVTVLARLDASNRTPGVLNQPQRASLIVRCVSGELEAYFAAGVVMDEESVRIRWDSDPIEPVAVSGSTSYRAVFFAEPRLMMGRLLKSKRLRVQFSPHGEGAAVADFSLGDFRAAAAKLRRYCPPPPFVEGGYPDVYPKLTSVGILRDDQTGCTADSVWQGVTLWVDTTGRVAGVRPQFSLEGDITALRAAIDKATFTPARYDEKPVEARWLGWACVPPKRAK